MRASSIHRVSVKIAVVRRSAVATTAWQVLSGDRLWIVVGWRDSRRRAFLAGWLSSAKARASSQGGLIKRQAKRVVSRVVSHCTHV